MLACASRIHILLQLTPVWSGTVSFRGALCTGARPAVQAQGGVTAPAPATLHVVARTFPQGGWWDVQENWGGVCKTRCSPLRRPSHQVSPAGLQLAERRRFDAARPHGGAAAPPAGGGAGPRAPRRGDAPFCPSLGSSLGTPAPAGSEGKGRVIPPPPLPRNMHVLSGHTRLRGPRG